ncbi:hypothetical protein [Methylocystis sp. S23]
MNWLALLFVIVAVLAIVGALAWLIWSTSASLAEARALEEEIAAARRREADAKQAEETRREIDRSDFGDAVDRL